MTICTARALMRAPIGCAVVLAVASQVSAQTLGDVARAEEARRKTVTSPGKVYTNERLRPDPTTPQPVAPSSTGSAAASPSDAAKPPDTSAKAADAVAKGGTAASKDTAAANAPPKDEASWRGKIKAARESLERAKIMADALQSRINGLNADFTARDDPQQRNVIASDLQRALTELDRTKKDVETQTKAIAQIQDEGRRAGVPAGWLR